MLNLKDGDFVLAESSFRFDGYHIAKVVATPTAKTVKLVKMERDGAFTENPHRRDRGAVKYVLAPGIDLLKLRADLRAAEDRKDAAIQTAKALFHDTVTGLASQEQGD